MSAVLHELNNDLETLMHKINCRLGGKYRLTLICRYKFDDLKDADIMKSDDDFDLAVSALRRLAGRDPLGATK